MVWSFGDPTPMVSVRWYDTSRCFAESMIATFETQLIKLGSCPSFGRCPFAADQGGG